MRHLLHLLLEAVAVAIVCIVVGMAVTGCANRDHYRGTDMDNNFSVGLDRNI